MDRTAAENSLRKHGYGEEERAAWKWKHQQEHTLEVVFFFPSFFSFPFKLEELQVHLKASREEELETEYRKDIG